MNPTIIAKVNSSWELYESFWYYFENSKIKNKIEAYYFIPFYKFIINYMSSCDTKERYNYKNTLPRAKMLQISTRLFLSWSGWNWFVLSIFYFIIWLDRDSLCLCSSISLNWWNRVIKENMNKSNEKCSFCKLAC